MDFVLEQTWKEIFALAAEAKAAKRREEQVKLFYETLDREKHHRDEIKERDEKEVKQLEELAATTAQLAAFNQHLDLYDTQTVHALMENGEGLEKISDSIRIMRDDAYALPDGRRVFKTQDGQHVFDEHGAAVGRETIDPQMIEDRHTKWEPFKAAKDAESSLQIERQGLLDYQAKLDEVRTRVGKGDITKQQLDDLDADLKASAPPAVRQKLGLTPLEAGDDAKPRPDQLSAAQQRALIDDMSRHAQPQPAPM